MSATTTITETKPKATKRPEAKILHAPMYHVILINDNDHTFDYVIEMLGSIFGHPPPAGFQMAWEVHTTGRVIVATVHLELAELKQEQVHAYGADPRIPRCKGSMTAVIEPTANSP